MTSKGHGDGIMECTFQRIKLNNGLLFSSQLVMRTSYTGPNDEKRTSCATERQG